MKAPHRSGPANITKRCSGIIEVMISVAKDSPNISINCCSLRLLSARVSFAISFISWVENIFILEISWIILQSYGIFANDRGDFEDFS